MQKSAFYFFLCKNIDDDLYTFEIKECYNNQIISEKSKSLPLSSTTFRFTFSKNDLECIRDNILKRLPVNK